VPASSGTISLVRLPDPEEEGTTTLQNVNNCTSSPPPPKKKKNIPPAVNICVSPPNPAYPTHL